MAMVRRLSKVKRKEAKKSFREEKYIKRSLENWKIETETGKQFKRILILLGTIILAYFLIGCSKKAKLSCYHETKLMQNKLNIKPKPTMA